MDQLVIDMHFFDLERVRVKLAHRVRCPPGWTWHSHDNGWQGQHLWLILAGRGLLRAPDARYRLASGDLFVLRMDEPVVAGQDDQRPLEVVGVHVDLLGRGNRPLAPSFAALPRHRRLRTPAFARGCADRCLEAWHGGDREAADRWARALIDEAARADADDRRHADHDLAATIDAWCAAMHDDPAGEHRPGPWASSAGVSLDHLGRVFRRLVGTTPRRYLVAIRIDRAQALLATSDLPVAAIADHLGYRDPFFFSRQFLDHTGVRPTAWRTRVRNPP